jgi:hypothetical protein
VGVADDGSIAVVGAIGDEDPNGGRRAGSAYVFSRSGGGWQQEAKLAADDGDSGDEFGVSVEVSGNGSTAVIGARSDEDPNGDEAGSAYVFSRSSGEWQQETKLAADDGDSGDEFGSSVGVSGDGSTAIIGAFGDEAGSAYVFE